MSKSGNGSRAAEQRVRFERQAEQLAGLHGAQAELESLRADRTSLVKKLSDLIGRASARVLRHAPPIGTR